MDNEHEHINHGEEGGSLKASEQKKAADAHTGHAMHMPPAGGGPPGHLSHGGHMAMIEDFKRRLIICLILTVPIIVLSPTIQEFFRYRLEFPGRGHRCGHRER